MRSVFYGVDTCKTGMAKKGVFGVRGAEGGIKEALVVVLVGMELVIKSIRGSFYYPVYLWRGGC